MIKSKSGDTAEIGFVVNCYLSNAISTEELQDWAAMVMGRSDSWPFYIEEILHFDAPRFHIYKHIGFTPSRSFTEEENEAIYGITYLREREAYDAPIKSKAIKSLRKNDTVFNEFKKTFPFIQHWSSV